MWSSPRRRTSSCRASSPRSPTRTAWRPCGTWRTSAFSHHLRILREAGVLTKRIQGTRGYTQLRKNDLDQRFPGLMDSVIGADASLAG
jgi:hypothetical protein